MKKNLSVGTALAPVPVVMVSCGTMEQSNIITLAWVGTVNSVPPMVSISVRRERYSYSMIDSLKEFTVNMVTKDLVRVTDICGTVSGRKEEKFSLCNLTKRQGERVACPYIEESPLSLECKVVDKKDFGSHTVFYGEIVNVIADERYVSEKGKFTIPEGELVAYSNGSYVATGEKLGTYGFTAKERTDR